MDFAAAIDAARSENSHGITVRAGKKYTTVAIRVEIARRHFGAIGIATEIVSWGAENGAAIVVKATVTSAEGATLATGHAEEIRGQGQVNRTSALENAETSAIGRALAALGINGGEFASADEMQQSQDAPKAQAQAQAVKAAPPPDTSETRDRMLADLAAANTLPALQAAWNGIHRHLWDLTPEDAAAVTEAKDARKAALTPPDPAGPAPVPSETGHVYA